MMSTRPDLTISIVSKGAHAVRRLIVLIIDGARRTRTEAHVAVLGIRDNEISWHVLPRADMGELAVQHLLRHRHGSSLSV